VELVEYLPAAHALQFVAPVAAPMLVIDPATHSAQYCLPVSV
jgi:hypothetical protein